MDRHLVALDLNLIFELIFWDSPLNPGVLRPGRARGAKGRDMGNVSKWQYGVESVCIVASNLRYSYCSIIH